MDPRLSATLQRVTTPTQAKTLCTYAVLCAREDLHFDEPDELRKNFIALHLGRVIYVGFSEAWSAHPDDFDWLTDQKYRPHFQRPPELRRYGRELGDRCLFTYSQETVVEHPRRGSADKLLIGLGRHGYDLAAANTVGWSDFERQILSSLSHRFLEYGELLGLAGILLGFTSVDRQLIAPARPLVTIDDFLEALQVFKRAPTHQNWQRLKQAAEDHRWTDPNFDYDLPAEPQE